MKRILSFFLSLVFVLMLFPITASAATATISISASAGSVVVGNQVTFNVDVSGSEKIGSWSIALKYDPSYLEYVSGADSGGGGSLLLVDSCEGQTKLATTKIVFKTKKLGSASLSVESAQIVSFDTTKPMTTGTPSRSISIVAPPTYSGDNNLSSLTVSPGELTPAFSAANTAYAVVVPFEIAKIDVSAAAAHSAARISISETELKVGENKIEVVVTAENGRTKTYTVTVTRKESDLAGVTTTLDGTDYTIAYDPSVLTPPEGFTASSGEFGGKKILTFASPQNTVTIVYLSAEEKGAWYLFDEAAQSFTEMISLEGKSAAFILLTPPEDLTIPEGFTSATVVVGEKELTLFRSDDSAEKGVYLAYAMAADGSCGLYYYDLALSSFTSYFDVTVPTVAPEKDDTAVEGSATLSPSGNGTSSDKMVILSLVLALVAVLLLIAWILTFVLLRKKIRREAELEKEVSFARPIQSRDSGNGLEELRNIYGIGEETSPPVQVETPEVAPAPVPDPAPAATEADLASSAIPAEEKGSGEQSFITFSDPTK